jgi:signal transduction histidine kinase
MQVAGPKVASVRLPVATAALMVAIFIADTVTTVEIAFSVFYVLVVLLAARFCRPRGVVLVTAGCVALALLSYILTPPSGSAVGGITNTCISVGTIVLTAGLILKDQTNEKLRQELAKRASELEQEIARINRVSMMGEMAASLGHEIKQPIAAVVSNAEACLLWLQREPPDVNEAREAMSEIVKCAMRAAHIIDRNRALFGQGAPQPEAIDLNEIIREMVTMLRDVASHRSIPIRCEFDPTLPTTKADRVQLQQVLMNLMLNGMEAMKERSGPLSVTSKRMEDGHLLVSVSDAGIGLPEGGPERVFEAFFTTKPHGIGMGLSISRRIIESHGGRLWATANPRRGATFHFTVPTT